MTLFFHSKRFDFESAKEDDRFYGEDLARWLSSQLAGWRSEVVEEDWGWAVVATKGDLSYIFGVYDHDTNEMTENGPRWCIRIFNQRDKSTPWFKKLLHNVPPVAHPAVIHEIETILSSQPDFYDIQKEPLA